MLEHETTSTDGTPQSNFCHCATRGPANRPWEAATDPAYVPNTYEIVIDAITGQTQIRGFRDGNVVESYRPYARGEACVAVNALINGYQPPRGLWRLETPTAQTPPAEA